MKLVQQIALQYFRTKFNLLGAISKKKAAEKAFDLFCTPQSRNKKALPPVFKIADPLSFTLDGVKVTGWRWMPESSDLPASGRKAMICHGFESSVINFDRYISPLLKKGYEVLAFDAPAHGRSGGKQINAPLYKKMILEVNKQYGPVHSFMAHSFGGLGLSLAMEEISHTPSHKLVLIAPATESKTAADTFFRFLQLKPSVRLEFDRLIIQKSGLSIEWYSIRRAMKNIRASVLWVHDEDDDTTPLSDALKVKEDGHENVEFMITKGLGHRRIYRENKVTKAIIDFL
jgi:predicted alpha/beta hydrolase family esterase